MRRVRSEARQRGIRLLGLLAESPFVGAQHARARALRQGQQPHAQRLAIQRLHTVEERQQQNRREIGQGDNHGRKEDARRKPPARRRETDEEVHRAGRGDAEAEANRQRLGLILQPRADGFVGKPVAVLEEEPAVEGQRKACDLGDEHQAGHVEDDGRCRGPAVRRDGCGRLRGGPHRGADAGPEKAAQKQDAPGEGEEARAALQPLIPCGAIFIHIRAGLHPQTPDAFAP